MTRQNDGPYSIQFACTLMGFVAGPGRLNSKDGRGRVGEVDWRNQFPVRLSGV
jgi:hypothetical protein